VKILLVSGDARVRAQVTTALIGRDDLLVTEVATPQRALQQVDDEGPWDIVIGDNDTAPTGGFFLAREIKARGQMGLDMPPVVLLLARDQDKWLSNWSQADAYVVKPVDPFDLAEVVTSLVEGRGVPALPRVGGDPTPSLLDLPSGERETAGLGDAAGGSVAGAGP
jgi:CheY-like chemotaxis protein